MRLNVGMGEHYAEGWVNTDEVQRGDRAPEVFVRQGEPYPFEDRSCEAIYCGHVLEHMAWPLVPRFLRDMRRLLTDDGLLMVTGPDCHKALEAWKRGSISTFLMHSVLEHQALGEPADGGGGHYWNCNVDRVVALLRSTGFTDEVVYPPDTAQWHTEAGVQWPMTNYTDLWQCAVLARKAW